MERLRLHRSTSTIRRQIQSRRDRRCSSARAEHTATTLLSGNVLVAGGMNVQGELQTAEVFDAAAGGFVATANAMSSRAPESHRHSSSAQQQRSHRRRMVGRRRVGDRRAVPRVAGRRYFCFDRIIASRAQLERGQCAELRGERDQSQRTGRRTGAGCRRRRRSSAELYGFATLKTDKDDYSPGMTVRVSGSGWQPNQPVTFYLRELPAEHYARLFTIDADGSRKYRAGLDLFLVEEHHLGVHFLMTAGDGVSQAHMAFTDSNPQTIAVAAPTSVTVVQGGTAVYGNVTVTVGGNTNPCAVTLGTALPCRRALWQCLAIVHRQPPEQISFPQSALPLQRPRRPERSRFK